MDKAGLSDKDLYYDTNPEYGHETHNESRSNYCGLCCLDCFCDNSETYWKSYGKTLYKNFLHLDEDDSIVTTTTTLSPVEDEGNELFKDGDVNNSEPIKFEKLVDSAVKGEERKKQILHRKKEEDEVFG